MVVIVFFLHYSVSRPSTLFLGLVLFAPLLASSHIVPKGWSYLVSCLGSIKGCSGMLKYVGPPMSSTVALRFSIIFFLSSGVLFVDGVFALVWTCSSYSCLESTKIVSCAWVRIWNSVGLVLVRFAISSLSSIAAHASTCSASALLTWVSVSCVWFFDAPYPWAAAVTFLRIW